MQGNYEELLKLLLPAIIIENFELTSNKTTEEVMHLYLQEFNHIPKEFESQKLESKGFFDEITVQDFPIRGHKVFLHIKRRRWFSHTLGKVVYRNWELVADGTRMTQEFAAFLKAINRF
ncbi:ISAon1 family transposase N-terminal region protein [Emticicia agri]|uniref:Transposase family protein n=1 Tax=Emticicia agri TaxID=2492393 RepID=A0A4Q5M4E4_9BACT|nr:transposase family protein [Emticicia agri]RYU90413.1 transposase family protein [Emticicia agri]RYU97326.1 transposase family protein [Emticicia agri]